ncbi:hypothetical protein LBMAG42_45540 [Deltaproteobacteria bacterium]|nr:hypothetical protein LBMAG42_45540 [Deltaproteobacteria bacterium]
MKLQFPATSRNRDPILAVLREVLAPPTARVLEVASGSGEHAAFFAAAMPWLTWQPTDVEAAHLVSIDAWAAEAELGPRLLPALAFNAATDPFLPGPWDGIFCANLVHISPWAVAEGLFRGAASALAPGGPLVTYGPYTIDGKHTSDSNVAFDESLKARDPRWGVRDVAALAAISPELELTQRIAMPANNFILVFRRV